MNVRLFRIKSSNNQQLMYCGIKIGTPVLQWISGQPHLEITPPRPSINLFPKSRCKVGGTVVDTDIIGHKVPAFRFVPDKPANHFIATITKNYLYNIWH